MKKQIFLGLLLASTLSNLSLAQNKGYITLTQAPTAGPGLYEAGMAKLKEAGVWDLGWNFHAIGAQQPNGLLSIGIFPDKASLDMRIAKNMEVFKSNNLSVPAPDAFEIHNMFRAPMNSKPANAVLIFHDVKGMTPEQYEAILQGLAKANAFGLKTQLFHACFKTPEGLKVVDIWESPEALQSFAGTLIPILTKIFGATPPPPAVYGLYNYVSK
ncbi:MAG: hypothetical protein SFV55_20680 [Haliscomenobacter sp.]|uniref:hypothetical protein n=1 Tax=Haliscomenobacter sp. TaxID=2717303 RepID=UPI0029A48B60|nr:hypothetical protein [Haliscomenobacter sp.]MDX2070857.1 hypothetical protein [Haliscomenobacter sp.]